MAFMHRAQRGWNVIYLLLLALQFYTAGLGIFGAADFGLHTMLGYGLVPGAVLLALLTLLARLPRSTVLLASALVPLTILQPVLAIAPRPESPAVAALHAVNALAIVLLAALVAQRSRTHA